jgi:hypothetical protein
MEKFNIERATYMFELLVTVAYDVNNRVYLFVLLLWKKR